MAGFGNIDIELDDQKKILYHGKLIPGKKTIERELHSR